MRLKSVIHAIYGYVDGIKTCVADCKECVRAAAPLRRDAQGRARRSVSAAVAVCNSASQRLGARRCARGRRLCGRSGSATAPTRCTITADVEGGELSQSWCTEMWQGRAQSRYRSGRGEPSPGADGCVDGLARLGHSNHGNHGYSWRMLATASLRALARADQKPWLPPGHCRQKRPFASMLRCHYADAMNSVL